MVFFLREDCGQQREFRSWQDYQSHDTIITHSAETRTLGDQLCDSLQGNVLCDATSHARAFPASTLLA
jgi:hypothetical protein